MSVIVELPPDVERSLRTELPDFDAEAKEAMLIGLYRRDNITRPQLSEALGLSRLETDAVLKKHNVTEDLPTNEELEEALAHMRALMQK